MRYSLAILLSLILIINSSHTNFDNGYSQVFPRSWDSSGIFKAKNVLAWVQFKDTGKYNCYRECLVSEFDRDTLNNPIYTLSTYINYHPMNPNYYTGGWELGYSAITIHHKDRFSASLHFANNIKAYNHQPDSAEVHNILKEWEFTIYRKGYPSVSAGVNVRLWKEVLGWTPNRAILVNKPEWEHGEIEKTGIGDIKH